MVLRRQIPSVPGRVRDELFSCPTLSNRSLRWCDFPGKTFPTNPKASHSPSWFAYHAFGWMRTAHGEKLEQNTRTHHGVNSNAHQDEGQQDGQGREGDAWREPCGARNEAWYIAWMRKMAKY